MQKAVEAERKRLREEQRIKRALDDQFPTADSAPDEVMHNNDDAGGSIDNKWSVL